MFIRGANPIWSMVDLTGHQLDDSYWMFVLENEIPYIPAPVYQDPEGLIPWNNPINFLANGTLPVDIYWDPGSDAEPNAYRIEIREGNTQSDPLIYLIENYVPGEGGGGPDDVGFTTDNQITNPQFSLVNFASSYSLTTSALSTDVEIGPGWILSLSTAGTGTVELTQVPLNSSATTVNSSNAPYALRIVLSGWSDAKLKQRFNQNGMLWSNMQVSSAITARSDSAGVLISANMVDSQGNTLGQVLAQTTVSGSFTEYTGHDLFPDTTNTDVPPDAWIEYQLQLQNNVDIYITSIQLLVSNFPIEPIFEQDSIERQIDHTFHYYEPQLAFKPVPSLLTGWDFTVNPAQFGSVQTVNNVAPKYIWDQTIAKSTVGNVTVARSSSALGIALTNSQPNESFYLMQYLTDGQAARAKASNLAVNLDGYAIGSNNARARVYLFVAKQGGSIPLLASGTPAIGDLNADGTFTLTDTTGWQEIPLLPGYSRTKTLNNVNTHDEQDISFTGFDGNSLYGSTTSTQLFCIVVSFFIPTASTFTYFNSISVVPGDIPTRPAQLTASQSLAQCEYYYEMSYNLATQVGTSVIPGCIAAPQSSYWAASNVYNYASPFTIEYKQVKQAAPNVTFYNVDGTIDAVQAMLCYFNGSNQVATASKASSLWTGNVGLKNAIFTPNAISPHMQTAATTVGNTANSAAIRFHYILDARLGVV